MASADRKTQGSQYLDLKKVGAAEAAPYPFTSSSTKPPKTSPQLTVRGSDIGTPAFAVTFCRLDRGWLSRSGFRLPARPLLSHQQRQ